MTYPTPVQNPTSTTAPTQTAQVQPTPPVSNASAFLNAIEANNRASQAGAQAQSGYQNAISAVGNLYGQTTALTAPYLVAGAQASNQMGANVQPYIGAGQNAIGNLQRLQSQPLQTQSFLDPSMQFAMSEGQKALERSAAARGGVLSGAALKDLTQYATGLASTNYNNAAQLAMQDRAQRIGIGEQLFAGGLQGNQQLGTIFQGGVAALGDQTTAANNYGQTLSTLLQGAGQSAANYTGQQQNLWAPAINAVANAYGAYQQSQNNTGQNTGGTQSSLNNLNDPNDYWSSYFA